MVPKVKSMKNGSRYVIIAIILNISFDIQFRNASVVQKSCKTITLTIKHLYIFKINDVHIVVWEKTHIMSYRFGVFMKEIPSSERSTGYITAFSVYSLALFYLFTGQR